MRLEKLMAIIDHRIALDEWHIDIGDWDSTEWDEEAMKRSVKSLAKTILLELAREETEVQNGRYTT